jgi:acyl-CoA dehydrogenase
MTQPSELLPRYGSPLYRYDLAEVRAAATALRRALPASATLFYSLKANPHPAIVEALRQQGCGAEVSSCGELATARSAGHGPGSIIFTGPGKSIHDVDTAIDSGVQLFSTESVLDLERVVCRSRAAGVDVQCLLRVNSATGSADTGIRMTGKPSQFGFDVDDAADWAPRALEIAGSALAGLHFFPVSNARSAGSIVAELERSLQTAAYLRQTYAVPVRWLDLGGGFAAPYAATGDQPDYGDLRDRIDAAIAHQFPTRGDEAPRLAFESGRYLVSAAGQLLASVTDVKRSKGRTFVVLDSGINHLGGMSALGRIMPLATRPLVRGAGGEPVTLVGPLCTPSDVLAREVQLGSVAVGDPVVIPNVGAYGLSASLVGFLSHRLPSEVVVDGDRVVSVSRQVLERLPIDAPVAVESPVELCRGMLPSISEHAARVDAEAAFPVENMTLLRKSGLLGLVVPREHGGMEAGLHEFVDVVQTLAGACTATAMIFAMHCQQVDAVVRFAAPALRANILSRVANGEVYLASVTSERESGGHLMTSAAALVEDGDSLVIDRDAPVVTGGAHADGFLITMRADTAAPPSSISLVYADRTQLEIEARGGWDPLGMRATDSGPQHLLGRVAADQIVGRPGHFREVAVDSLIPVGHIGWSAVWLGTARQALAQLVGQLRGGGRTGADLKSDLFAERLARVRIELETVSAYLRRVVDEIEDLRVRGESVESGHVQIHLNTLKVLAAESSFAAVDRTMQIAGLKLGYMKDSPLALERAFRDLRSAALNYANDRLLRANGLLQLTDREVRLI